MPRHVQATVGAMVVIKRARRPAQHRAAHSARALPGRGQPLDPEVVGRYGSMRRRPASAQAESRRAALHRRRRVARPVYRNLIINASRRPRAACRRHERGAGRSRAGEHLRHGLRHSAGSVVAVFEISSRNGVASVWGSLSRERSSSSSGARSRSRARSARARRSCSIFRAPVRGRSRSSQAEYGRVPSNVCRGRSPVGI